MALEMGLPLGWVLDGISDGGKWDALHRKVKWGPFMDNLSRTVTFTARRRTTLPIAKARAVRGAQRREGFSGTVSFDGVNYPIAVE
jgi:hypothetical protein